MIEEFLACVRSREAVSFDQTMAVIAALYRYTPTAFSNGLGEDRIDNPPGTNEGSCKLFAFAKLNGLSEAETLALFGDYYRRDVLENPTSNSHRNIRTFMKYGWSGIRFDGDPLTNKDVTNAILD